MSELDDGKKEAMERRRWMLTQCGNLTLEEVEEWIRYGFITGPTTLREQVRSYYLLVKENSPVKAEKLLAAAEPHVAKGVRNEQEVHDLCVALSQFINGVVIYPELPQEVRDEMEQEFPLPLKTMTAKADKSYQVWRGGTRLVLWKAWRQGRPTVLGYGMTEEEAVDDLRYRVQPDHDGTLDGLGKASGALIGGNMFSENDVLRHNKSRFDK